MPPEENSEKLGKIKAAVERKDLEEEESTPSGNLDDRVSEIVKRLKAKDDEHKGSGTADSRFEAIKQRIQGTSAPIKVSGKGLATIQSTPGKKQADYFAVIGKIYSALKGPVDKLSSFVSDTPLGQNLKETLDSAGIAINPEDYLILVCAVSITAFLAVLFLFGAISIALGDVSLTLLAPIIAIAAAVLVVVLGLVYPSAVAGERATRLNRDLPFALRQLATQIKAGVSFHKALRSIATSRYGVLSEEFTKVLQDIERGYSTDQALMKLMARTKSKGLKKALVQILRALKSGGNLSNTITAIADDVAFELRMKVRDFTEKLNFVSVIYIMVGVVGPVVVTILSSIAQLPLIGGNFPFEYIVIIFAAIIVMMLLLLFIINRMEPG